MNIEQYEQDPVIETDMTPTIGALLGALAKAQGQMTGARKDAQNPHLKSKYADLASVWDAIRAPLSANELAVLQLTEPAGTQAICVVTILGHSSGEYIRSRLTMPVTKQDAQGFGSAITYARRYALSAMTGVAPEDDDGEGASDRSGPPREPHPPMRQERPAAPPAQTGPATNGKNTLAESEAAKAVAHAMQEAARIGDRDAVMLHYADAANRKPGFGVGLMKRLGEIRDQAIEACNAMQGAAQ